MTSGGRRARAVVGALILTSALLACERREVDVEFPASGRQLTRAERGELQRVAEASPGHVELDDEPALPDTGAEGDPPSLQELSHLLRR